VKRIGIIGTGQIAQGHLRRLHGRLELLPTAELALNTMLIQHYLASGVGLPSRPPPIAPAQIAT